MSDNIEQLKLSYDRHVKREPSSIINKGLFPIPELPEMRSSSGGEKRCLVWWLAWLLGKNGFLTRFLRMFTLTFKALIYPIDKERDSVITWLQKTTTIQVESMDLIWQCGWIVCAAIDGSLPGVCAGHSANKVSLEHAQNLAEHYLGVEPVFSKEELEENYKLSRRLEWKLVHYLLRIEEALDNLAPAVSKPNTPRTNPESPAYTLDYVARGIGLHAAQTNKKSSFKIYPTAQQSLEPGEITVMIRGPNEVSSAVVPPIYGKTQILRQNFMGLNVNPKYTEPALPLTQGAGYFRSYGKNDMKKMFYIPKVIQDVDIEVDVRRDHAKITYETKEEGSYEITLISRGCDLVGSPFKIVSSSENIECEHSPDLEDDDECGIVDVKTDRKVVLRIVDFVTEKMLLKENGQLEKISDDEAEELITKAVEGKADVVIPYDNSPHFTVPKVKDIDRFRESVEKIRKMNRVCKRWKRILKNRRRLENLGEESSPNPSLIPDVVNSTFYYKETDEDSLDKITITHTSFSSKNPFIDDKVETPIVQAFNLSSNNPFLNLDILENEIIPVTIPTKETKTESQKGLLSVPMNNAPVQRPKTPILKIINDELEDRPDSVYFSEIENRSKSNEYLNPIYGLAVSSDDDSKSNRTDFIIGAPVSLHQRIHTSTPEPQSAELDSIIAAPNLEEALKKYEEKIKQITESNISNDNSTLKISDDKNPSVKSYQNLFNESTWEDKKVPLRRMVTDSAYVSIDDFNSSSDNNNSNTGVSSKIEDLNIDYHERHFQMGPAELELWKTCQELTEIPLKNKNQTCNKIFTPIKEEIDSSLVQNSIEAENTNLNIIAEPDSLKRFQNCEKVQARDRSLHIDYTTVSHNGVVSSEYKADENRGQTEDETQISAVQNISESGSANWSFQENDALTAAVNTTKSFSEKPRESIVLEKKKYWDRYLEEIKLQHEKQQELLRSLSRSSKSSTDSDSESKKRSKNTVKTLIVSPDASFDKGNTVHKKNEDAKKRKISPPSEARAEPKLVSKWRKYWDEKVDQIKSKEKQETSPSHKMDNAKQQIPVTKRNVSSNKNTDLKNSDNNLIKTKNEHQIETDTKCITSSVKTSDKATKTSQIMHVTKQSNFDLDEDSVLKAFENNPKTFFGTSRRNIIEKIDTYLVPSEVDVNVLYSNEKSIKQNNLVTTSMEMFKCNKSEHSSDKIDKDHVKRVLADMIEKRKSNIHKSKSSFLKNLNFTANTTTKRNGKFGWSKSEMDLFNKNSTQQDKSNSGQSCEDIPKMNIKSVISLFEKVDCTEDKCLIADKKIDETDFKCETSLENKKDFPRDEKKIHQSNTNAVVDQINNDSHDSGVEDSSLNTTDEISDDVETKIEPRQRFKMAKMFFQSLNNVSMEKTREPNECELLLLGRSEEYLRGRLRRGSYSFSAPVSDNENDVSSISSDYEDFKHGPGGRRLMKISEKFQVDDLYNDVVGEGKLSRQGSFKGIPNKQAVLATFKSMDNVEDRISSYDIAVKQLKKFADENKNMHIQRHQSEYPYLPKTEPNKYRSRFDARASGLISRKELLRAKTKPRRNSVPDLFRLNETFSETI